MLQVRKKGGTPGSSKKRPHASAGEYLPILFFSLFLSLSLSFAREAIPISYRALWDKLGDGSVIIPSRIRTRCRLRIRVALHFFLFFSLFCFSFISLFSFFYRTRPSELNAQLRRLSPCCNPREKYIPAVIFASSLSLSLTRVWSWELAKFVRSEDLISTIKRASAERADSGNGYLLVDYMVLVNLAMKQMTFHSYRTRRKEDFTRESPCNGNNKDKYSYFRYSLQTLFFPTVSYSSRFSARQKFMPFRSSTWHNLAAESSHVHDVRLLTFAFSRRTKTPTFRLVVIVNDGSIVKIQYKITN